MSVNPHDDYEKLAKLLYPSIEASGNVYYGQTRKLTMDEILQKNDLYFDSSIKAVPVYTDTVLTGYINYFCWKIGPLSGKIILPDSLDNITADAFTDSIKRILYADNTEIVYDEDLIYDFTNNTSKLSVFGTIFAKYRLDIISNAIDNRLNSGNYNSYEKEITPVFDGLYVTDNFNPTDATDWNIANRHFYIAKEDVDYYLYIQILTSEDTEEYLTFIPLDTTADNKISLSIGTNEHRYIAYSEKSYDGTWGLWQLYNFGSEQTVTNGIRFAYHKVSALRQSQGLLPQDTFGTNENDALRFHINSGKFFVYGNCGSLLHLNNDNTLPNFAFGWLFYDINNLYGTPILPKDVTLGEYCYASMFNNCISLHVAPKLTADELKHHCYHDMFNGCIGLFSPPRLDATLVSTGSCYRMFKDCTELRYSPYLLPKNLKGSCYDSMFYNCNKLKLVRCFAVEETVVPTRAQYPTPTLSWLYNVSTNGTFIRYGLNYSYPNNPNTIQNGIPTNWKVITIEENDNYYNSLVASLARNPKIGYRLNKCDSYHIDYLTTSGSDSKDNGRGSVLDPNTLSNMEKSFDENGTHLMNTYNADGSFNQEVWGYKTFNSPVQFKNGIYGECANLITVQDGGNIYSTLASSISDGNTLISVGKFNQEIVDDEYNVTYNYNLNTAKLLSESSIDDIMPDDSMEINQLSSTTASTGFIKLASSDDLSDYVNWPYTQVLSTASYTSNTNDNNESKLDLNLLVVPEAKISAKMVTNKDNIDIISDAYVKCQPNGIGADISLYATHNYDGVENTAYATLSVDRDIYSGDIDKNFRINANIAPSLYSNGIFDIGESDNKFNTVYANYLHGILPYIGNGSYRPEPGSINYSTLHLYSADTDHADIEVHAGDKLTIKHDTSFWINDVQQTGVTAYLYSTCLKYDTTSNTTELTEGRQYGVVSNLYGIEFTPLCDFKITFFNRRSGSDDNSFGDGVSIVVPPKFDDVVDDSIRDIDYDYELAKITDEIEREEGRQHALEVGSVQQWKDRFQEWVGLKITDHDIFGNHDDLFGDNGTLIGNPQYTDPTKPMHTIDTLHTINYSRNDTGIIKLSAASLKNATGTLTSEQQAVKTKLENNEILNENDLSVVKSYAKTNIFTDSLQNNIKSGLQANFNKKF